MSLELIRCYQKKKPIFFDSTHCRNLFAKNFLWRNLSTQTLWFTEESKFSLEAFLENHKFQRWEHVRRVRFGGFRSDPSSQRASLI